MRFAIRPAVLDDAEGIAQAHTASWRTSYRGILPDDVLARINVDQRAHSWRQVVADPAILTLVAYDTSRGDIVGVCDAGPNRSRMPQAGEIYRLYFEHHARRHGLGRDMFEHVIDWLRSQRMRSLVIWVLEGNHHARRFYEAMGGQLDARVASRVQGFPVVEQAYVWNSL